MSDTIRKGIIDIEPYRNDTGLLMVGNVAALSGKPQFIGIFVSMIICNVISSKTCAVTV